MEKPRNHRRALDELHPKGPAVSREGFAFCVSGGIGTLALVISHQETIGSGFRPDHQPIITRDRIYCNSIIFLA
jgi:hypothetical protein